MDGDCTVAIRHAAFLGWNPHVTASQMYMTPKRIQAFLIAHFLWFVCIENRDTRWEWPLLKMGGFTASNYWPNKTPFAKWLVGMTHFLQAVCSEMLLGEMITSWSCETLQGQFFVLLQSKGELHTPFLLLVNLSNCYSLWHSNRAFEPTIQGLVVLIVSEKLKNDSQSLGFGVGEE